MVANINVISFLVLHYESVISCFESIFTTSAVL